GLITGIAAIGMLVALSGLRSRPTQQMELPGDLRVGELMADGVEAGLAASGDLTANGDLAANGQRDGLGDRPPSR
ncbi:MAG TPA: hypothetical protein VKG61_12645, partial [Streptosporangiaceae bacterium]|nr:hypothetical protein [Streptosporangiaceae bacterium]